MAEEPIVVEKPVVCGQVSSVLNGLKDTYKEEPIWVGNGNDRSRYSLFVNPKTGAFTILQFNNEIACLIGTGESSLNLPTRPTL